MKVYFAAIFHILQNDYSNMLWNVILWNFYKTILQKIITIHAWGYPISHAKFDKLDCEFLCLHQKIHIWFSILHFSLFTLRSLLFTPYSSLFILHSSFFILHSSFFILYSSFFAVSWFLHILIKTLSFKFFLIHWHLSCPSS